MQQAVVLSDLWNDRRVRQVAFEGPERRSGQDRRHHISHSIAIERRSSRRTRQIWRSGRLDRVIIMAGDGLAIMLSFGIAFMIALLLGAFDRPFGFGHWWHDLGRQLTSLHSLMALSVVLAFRILGHYARRIPFWDELPRTLQIIAVAAAANVGIVYFLQIHYPRVWLLSTWLLALIMVPVARIVIKHWLIHYGGWMRPTVIIGTGKNALEAAHALSSEPLLGFQVKAFLAPPETWPSSETARGDATPTALQVGNTRIPVYALGNAPAQTLKNIGKPHVVCALETTDVYEISKLLQDSRGAYSSLNLAPPLRGLPLIGTEMVHFFRHETMLLQVRNNLGRRMPQKLKRMFDLLVSSLMLTMLAPLFAFFAWRISKSGNHIFFGHTRVGQNGKPFKCYKFRTMVPNADQVLNELLTHDPSARQEWNESFKLRNDPRITPIGAFLRKTSLDELPQLWNVLKGEMSLVGPRPVIDAELERYGTQVNYYLEAKPGITGLWQVSGRSDTSYDERVALDSWYAKNWTLWYDIVILMKTFREVLAKKGAY